MAITITAAEKKILQDVTIPPRPEALLEVSQEAKQPEPNVQKIANAIAGDIGISAAVLQVVNSAAFRRSKEIKSIDQAVMVLGLKRVFPIVKAVALKSAMDASEELNQFWQDSTEIANVCALVANQLEKPQLSDNAYMLGLFHAAGIPVMFLNFPSYGPLMHKAEAQGWDDDLLEEENKICETNHTTIGALLGQRWKLAKDLNEVIYYQHDCSGMFTSTELSKVGLWLLAILKIARHIVLDVAREKTDTPEWDIVRDPIQTFLGFEDDEMQYVLETVIANIQK